MFYSILASLDRAFINILEMEGTLLDRIQFSEEVRKQPRLINVGALYQHHTPIASVDGLKWYVGGGASAWIWTYDKDYNFGSDYNNINLGIMGCLGLDYKFADFPINLSVDWVPTFVVGNSFYSNGFGVGYGALAARYTLK